MFTQQLHIQQNTPVLSCAFTGHRRADDFPKTALLESVQALVNEGCYTFYCGLAQGFDLLAAKTVLEIKKQNPAVKLIACIPCNHQEKYYPAAEKKLYGEVLRGADESVYLAEAYYRGCMHVRDRYMADNADALIAFLQKEKGGTAYTVGYFQKKHPHKKVIFL